MSRSFERVARLQHLPMALLMAVLLVAPLLDCTLHPADEHTHSASAMTVPITGGSHTVHPQGAGDHPGDHCDQHMTRCVEKSVLPSRGAAMPSSLWMALIGMATLAAVALVVTGARGIRGPPGARSPVSSGQAILIDFCISRR